MGDRILPRDELTYPITNITTWEGSAVSITGKGDKQKARYSALYQDLLCWRAESGYDFEETRRDRYRDEYGRRPFMDIVSDFKIYLRPWLGYHNKTYSSTYDG